MKKKYTYAGRNLCSGNKLGYKLKAIGEKDEDIFFSSRKSLYYQIGQTIEVDIDKEGRFSHNPLEEYADKDLIIKLELTSNQQENDHKEIVAGKKAAKNKLIGKMTVDEFIEWSKGSTTRKLLIQKFVDNKLWRSGR